MNFKPFLAAALGAATLAACAATETSEPVEAEVAAEQPNIVALAAGTESLSTLVTAVTAAGLVETLSGPGPFTVFAPDNAAFDKLPDGTVATLVMPENKDTLTGILTYHVVAGEVMAADVIGLIEAGDGSATIDTVAGGQLTASIVDGAVVLTDAQGGTSTVTATDIDASNGVVHLIDTVVMP
jgi:uncharacterized surface protein with fasciclin (FAS1) repeats